MRILNLTTVALVLFGSAYTVEASTLSSTLEVAPNTANVGDIISFTITEALNPTNGFNDSIASSNLSINFGDGSLLTPLSPSPYGATSYAWNISHAYSTPGLYTISLSGNVLETWNYYYSTWVYSGYYQSYSYSCGIFNTSTCYGSDWVDTSHYETRIGSASQSWGVSQGASLNVIQQAAPKDANLLSNNVPEPATLALMGLGFAGMAMRRRKSVQA